MAERPYTLLSCAMTIDGYISTATRGPLRLSNAADIDRVDAVRAGCDAILVGAATVRNDRPRLLLRSPARSEARRVRGLTTSPTKVTITAGGRLDPSAPFFTMGDVDKLVYCAGPRVEETRRRLQAVATVVDAGPGVDLRWIIEDLHRRGVRRLLVEGGRSVHTQLLTADLADELQLTVAPFFLGEGAARRFVGDGEFPWRADRRATLAAVRQVDDMVLLRYALSSRFRSDPPEDP